MKIKRNMYNISKRKNSDFHDFHSYTFHADITKCVFQIRFFYRRLGVLFLVTYEEAESVVTGRNYFL